MIVFYDRTNKSKILSVSKNVTSEEKNRISLQSSVGSSLPSLLIMDALQREERREWKRKRGENDREERREWKRKRGENDREQRKRKERVENRREIESEWIERERIHEKEMSQN